LRRRRFLLAISVPGGDDSADVGGVWATEEIDEVDRKEPPDSDEEELDRGLETEASDRERLWPRAARDAARDDDEGIGRGVAGGERIEATEGDVTITEGGGAVLWAELEVADHSDDVETMRFDKSSHFAISPHTRESSNFSSMR
jgi:hypothetical protein